MRGTSIALVALAACGSGTRPAVAPPSAAARALHRGPIRRVMVPAELGDAGALERIPYGVHIARFGQAWFVLGAEADQRLSGRTFPIEETWPVIAEAPGRIQVVSTEDDVHLALWIDRADVATSVIDDVAVTARPGDRAAAAAGLELAAGAPVTTTTDRAADTVEIRYTDPWLAAVGWVPTAAIGDIFPVDRGATRERPAASTGSLVPGAVIRTGPQPSAREVASVRDVVPALLGAEVQDGWREVRVATRYARVHGWVEVERVSDDLLGSFGTTGHGSGFGGSHRLSLLVPAGTCLYAAADGEVVGVAVETETRLVLAVEQPGWWQVTVSSPWGLHDLYVRDSVGGRDVGAARLESCADPDRAP